MFRFLLSAALLLSASATELDRIAIIVGQQVITQQQLDEELRVAGLLNTQKITRTIDSRRAAADRLVQQLLVKREMDMSHYPLPSDEDVDNYLAQVRSGFASQAAFDQALAQYDLSESVLKDHLALQLTTLRFIEFRFRPDASISDAEIQAAYQREIAEWKKVHPGVTPPSLASSREALQKTLLEERTDEALNLWLEETRKQVNIVYLDKTLG